MCFHGNRISWGINHSFISLYSKYQPPSIICSPITLAPVISSLDEIYCTFLHSAVVAVGRGSTVFVGLTSCIPLSSVHIKYLLSMKFINITFCEHFIYMSLLYQTNLTTAVPLPRLKRNSKNLSTRLRAMKSPLPEAICPL